MVKFVLTKKFKMAKNLLKTNPPLFHYSIFEESDQTSKNVVYFHKVVEIPQRIF